MKKILISISLFFLISGIFSNILIVNAQNEPICVPTGCPEDYVPDFDCVSKQLLNPADGCCENKCRGEAGQDQPTEFKPLFTFFDTDVRVETGQQIPTLINLVITTFLGLISVYAAVYGIYIAGFVRAKTTDAAEIERVNKILRNLILGFILAWSFIIIIQLVANTLGLGSLNSLELVEEGGSDVITI